MPVVVRCLIAIAIAALLGPATASAAPGQLRVYYCHTPSGAFAAADWWLANASGASTYTGGYRDTCTDGGGGSLQQWLVAGASGADSAGTGVRTRLTAPADVSLVGGTIHRKIVSAHPDVVWSSPLGSFRGVRDEDNTGAGRPGLSWTQSGTWDFSLMCYASWVCDSGRGGWTPEDFLNITRLDADYADAVGPVITASPSGGILQDPQRWQTGATGTFNVSASDTGSGVYRAFLRKSDGTTVYSTLLSGAPAACKDANPGDADAYQFAGTATPCGRAAQAYSAQFDMASLGDGQYSVVAGVEDASGRAIDGGTYNVRVNAPAGTLGDVGQTCQTTGRYDESGTCVGGSTGSTGSTGTSTGTTGGSTGGGGGGGSSTPDTASTKPSGASTTTPTPTAAAAPSVGSSESGPPAHAAAAAKVPNGIGASPSVNLRGRFLRSATARLSARYGTSLGIEGRLVDPDGKPVAGASLDVLQTPTLANAGALLTGTVQTDANGIFRYVTKALGSRTVKFAYRAYSSDAGYAQTLSLDLRVLADLRLQVTPRRTRNGKTIRLSGRVVGAPATSGKTVEVQAFNGTSWVTFGTPKLRKGKYSHRYRFTRTISTTRYKFRAVVRGSARWPFETTTTSARAVVVRP